MGYPQRCIGLPVLCIPTPGAAYLRLDLPAELEALGFEVSPSLDFEHGTSRVWTATKRETE